MSLLNCVPYVPACQNGLRSSMLACHRGLRTTVLTCQRAKSVPASHFYVPINVPTCQFFNLACQHAKACQYFNLACQRVEWRANFSTWRANVPKGVPIFQTFLLRNAKWNFYSIKNSTFYYILLHSRNSTFYHSYTYQMYVYVS